MAEVRMPKMGDGMETGTINRWLKQVGDKIASGDVIAEIETDKASVEITAYDTGVLSKIVIEEGASAPVGDVIAIIGSAVGAAAAAPAATRPAASASAAPSVAPVLPQVDSSGPDTERVKASPLARRIAAERGIDLARVTGTGPGGRIVERDVADLAAAPAQAQDVSLALATPEVSAISVPSAPSVSTPAPSAASTTYSDIKPTRMRDAIARRVTQSKQTVPHFYVTMKVTMDKAVTLLKELNAETSQGKITVNDLIVKACAGALAIVPDVNATWTAEGTIRRYNEAHIGVAVGIDDGLIIPVVKNCESKTLRQISADARELIGKARAGQLRPDEYSGGTFSVSNLGMMGVDEFLAIINPPEAAILAIGGIVREPVVVDDAIEIKSIMKITISADHRLLDGVVAAKFVVAVKKALEAPYTLLS